MRKIRKIWRYLPTEFKNKEFVMYLPITDNEILSNLGFSFPFVNFETIVPKNDLNVVTKENANGKETIRRDLPKESFSIDFSFIAPNFGDYSKGTHIQFGSFEGKRYKREYGPPSLLRFVMVIRDNATFVYSEKMFVSDENEESLCLLFNLFRFCFGVEPQFAADYQTPVMQIVRKEWDFLPKGTRMEKYLEDHPIKAGKSEVFAFILRLEYLEKFSVDNTVSVGRGGFYGYFCIKTKRAFVLECIYSNTATYIVDLTGDWAALSKLTKTDIITNNAAVRVFHTKEWETKIKPFI